MTPGGEEVGEGKDKGKGVKDLRGQRLVGVKVAEGVCRQTGGGRMGGEKWK